LNKKGQYFLDSVKILSELRNRHESWFRQRGKLHGETRTHALPHNAPTVAQYAPPNPPYCQNPD